MTQAILPSRAGILLLGGLLGLLLSSCAKIDPGNEVIVSVRDQKMMIFKEGAPVKSYRISTSKFGLGDKPGSMNTPLGTMRIARKIGEGAPAGAVFKSRRRTGEILRPNSPGRDPIVSRIIWLKGTEKKNRNAFRRYIYIHGTPEERTIGRPASYGCIRMKSRDVIDFYRRVGVGAEVRVIRGSLFGLPLVPGGEGFAEWRPEEGTGQTRIFRGGPSI
ncbi:MAG TPA: hypothetical protein DD438_00510 [Verrucomicrobiales bacterium]|nr:hypothetical protein [Verrucomicrobiales bacterium]|tara:strand:- start:123 stop:776 length:654 start_codon:yes stop_codon:yes gene_type:complete